MKAFKQSKYPVLIPNLGIGNYASVANMLKKCGAKSKIILNTI